MKLVLDTCVLFPTVMREMLTGAAGLGHFTPLWSGRILEEWARAARKLGPDGEAQARAEIALLKAAWPRAELPPAQRLEARLFLPDPGDIHVLAVAVAGSADAIVTLNAKDFPRRILTEEGVDRIDPDTLMMRFLAENEEGVRGLAKRVLAEADQMSGRTWTLRQLFKKARLPRLAKALSQPG
ncbi:MAG: PIN domain-containing protein [Pseudomonadota bacterium]